MRPVVHLRITRAHGCDSKRWAVNYSPRWDSEPDLWVLHKDLQRFKNQCDGILLGLRVVFDQEATEPFKIY